MIRQSGALSGGSPPAYQASNLLPQIPISHAPPPPFPMDPNLILQTPPPLDPAWLAHERAANLLTPPAVIDPKDRQKNYSQKCRDLNAHLLSGRDEHLNHGIIVHNTQIENYPEPPNNNLIPLPLRSYNPSSPLGAANGRFIPIRSYNPSSLPSGPVPLKHGVDNQEEGKRIVIYYHGGGLYVGDLDSEDMTCRRICKELQCTVYSCDYRLMPHYSADDALCDAHRAFMTISSTRKASRLIVMGSSSGGQLAAQISQQYPRWRRPNWNVKIHGVLLRGPVTCDATEEGANLPSRFRQCHTSMSEPFHTTLLSSAAVNAGNRTNELLPLEREDLKSLPRHWIQVSTNDIYYSDGACYAEALREAGVEVKLDVVEGWPHTFWLKAPELDRAVKAEADMIEGLRWLLESEVEDEEKRIVPGPGGFVPFTDEEFESKFMNV